MEYPEHVPLVHCSHCGYRLTFLEFLDKIQTPEQPALGLAKRTWPEKIRACQIDAAEIRRVEVHGVRSLLLQQGHWLHAACVIEDGLRPTFGDWVVLPDEALRLLLAVDSFPAEVRQRVYLLQVLRSITGQIVAVDVYTCEYLPLFRHWLVLVRRAELFAVPVWTESCDRTRERLLCDHREVAHELEVEALGVPRKHRNAIWLPSAPQPIAA